MREQFKNTNLINLLFYFVIIAVFITGIYIRIRYYLAGVPMWIDEILLASNLTDCGFKDLFAPLDGFLKTPPLFFLCAMTLRKLFGINELTLRFIPFVLSIASLFGFFFLLKENIKNKIGILSGLFMFSFCVPLIYFSAEFKQYGCDVFFAIVLLLLYNRLDFNNLKPKKIILYTLGSILFVFFSFPAIILIPAIILSKIIGKKFNPKILWIFGGLIFAGLSLLLYDIKTYTFLKNYWNSAGKGFSHIPNLKFITGFVQDACNYFVYNFHSGFVIVILCLITAGLVVLFKENKNKAFMVLLTFFFAIISSAVNAYPLSPKLALYMLPMFLLLITKFFDITEFFNKNYTRIIFNICIVFILIFTFGIKIPYLNINQNQIIYYNQGIKNRNKSIEDRLAVKNICLKILKNYKSGNKILASEEFLYSLKYYGAVNNYDKKIDIIPYAETDETRLSDYTTDFAQDFIKDNKTNLFIVGRNNERFFTCPNLEILEEIIAQNKLKYKKYTYKDIYLVEINQI